MVNRSIEEVGIEEELLMLVLSLELARLVSRFWLETAIESELETGPSLLFWELSLLTTELFTSIFSFRNPPYHYLRST